MQQIHSNMDFVKADEIFKEIAYTKVYHLESLIANIGGYIGKFSKVSGQLSLSSLPFIEILVVKVVKQHYFIMI